MMHAYSEVYLEDVVKNQGELFDFVSYNFPEADTKKFIKDYMKSKTRKSIDEAQAYVNTMSADELWDYFLKTEHYILKPGKSMQGFMPDWRILCILPMVLWYIKFRSNKRSAH